LRIINYPKRGIGDTVIAELQSQVPVGSYIEAVKNVDRYDFSSNTQKKLKTFCAIYNDLETKSQTMSLQEFVEYMVDIIDFKGQFDPKNDDEYDKIQNIDQFVTSVCDFAQNNLDCTLQDYLESITLISDIDSVADNDDNLLISTVHAVKGLEYKVVFIVALENGMFPIIRTGDRPSDIEEERRLMYVAITRAKERLYLTMSKKRYLYNQIKYQDMSPFLEEMGFDDDDYGYFGVAHNYTKRKTADLYTTEPPKQKNNLQDVFESKIQSQQKDISAYRAGVKVMHPKFGVGVIIDDTELIDSRRVTINFDIVGNKTLSLDYAPLQILKK